MKIFKMNFTDWVCANNESEAIEVYKKHINNQEVWEEIKQQVMPIFVNSDDLAYLSYFDEENNKWFTFKEVADNCQEPSFLCSVAW